MNSRSVMLNELAQGRRAMEEGLEWFGALDLEEQRAVLRELASYTLQARAGVEDRIASIEQSGLRPTQTPAVMIAKGDLPGQLAKMTALPAAELSKTFRLMIALLGIADARRYERDCVGGCTHAWHHFRE